MVLSSLRMSLLILLALGLALCVLPGCGSGNSSVTTSTLARSRTQTFQGQDFANATYALDTPIDQTKPFVVTVGGTPLVQGKDYFIDQQFPNIIHVNNAVPATTSVVVQYTTLPTVIQRFNVDSANQTTFTLSRPVDATHLNVLSVVLDSPGLGPAVTLTSQQYTITAGPPTVIRLSQPVSPPRTLSITYVPQVQ